jgi:glutamine amidotransferase
MCRWLAYSGSPIRLEELLVKRDRHSTEGSSRSLHFSTRMDALKAHYPDSDALAALSDETRVVVSEPLGDLEGAWNEVPESHVGIVRPGDDELRPFTPRRP